jgi:transcriptional regulator with XRE-family HTH domain
MNKINDKVATKIKQLRVKKRLSQEETSFELNMSQAAYCKLENGETLIDISKLEKIAKYFNASI